MKSGVQRFGRFLSAMVMPNIGALIAFGFLAALFIDTGWFPNEGFNSMVTPMLTYLIPILIASTGGRMIGGDRGRVVAAIAVIGAILSNPSITMLMAAMIIGPLSGVCIKKFDQLMEGRMTAGFEMLINNFSAGIIGMLLAMLGYVAIGPLMSGILAVLSAGISFLMERSLLPLASVFIEPAKVLFLNNAINHGIFTPIATLQAESAGKSIMYMLESNPGPGLGILLAYLFFSKDKVTRDSTPGAVVIHLLGGIHEIYFPYILMNPVVIIAPILGNMAAIFWYSLTGCGLVGPASPGSIIAYLMMTPGPDIAKVLVGVLIGAGVSFAAASPIVKLAGGKSLEEAQNELAAKKAEAKGQQPVLDALYVQLTTGDSPAAPAGENTDLIIPDVPVKKTVLIPEGIRLNQKTVTKEEAIQAAGELLEELGYVDGSYVEAMQERERLVSTYMGMGVAIPHGTTQAKGTVKKSGIVFFQYPDGVDFGEEKAQLVVGIAGVGDEHLDLLGNLCTVLEDEARLETLKTTDDAAWVLEQLS